MPLALSADPSLVDSAPQRFEVLREKLSQLSALGLVPDDQWQRESPCAHLWLAWRHAARSLLLAVRAACLALRSFVRWCTTKRPDEPEGSEGSEAREMWEKHGLILPLGTWKEKWDLIVLALILYSAIVVRLGSGPRPASAPAPSPARGCARDAAYNVR
jgi:hypothetical protein